MMKYLLCALAAIIGATPAGAFTRGQAWGPGKAQINIPNLTAQMVVNQWNALSSLSYNSGATPAALDQYMYPVRNFTGTMNFQLGGATLSTTGPWVFAYDAGRSCFKFRFSGKTATITSIVGGATITQNGQNDTTIEGNCGVAGSMVINFSNTTPISGIFYGTTSTPSYSRWDENTTGRMWFVRQSDLARYNAGVYWTQEFIAAFQGLKPEAIRALGWNSNIGYGGTGSNVVNWGYRRTIESLAWATEQMDFPPGTRCGGATSFCTMSVSSNQVTAAAAADTNLSGWTDGEQITGALGNSLTPMYITGVTGSTGATSGNCKITVSDVTPLSVSMTVLLTGIGGATECLTRSTTILSIDSGTNTFVVNVPKGSGTYTSGGQVGYQTLTITGKSAPAKNIVVTNGGTISSTYSSGIFVNFTYNATLDQVILAVFSGEPANGITNSVPLEAQLQLWNMVGAHFWITLPTWASDDFIANTTNAIYAGLNPSLKMYVELANEFFNNAQQAAGFGRVMGSVLGITPLATASQDPWQGLRSRQIFGLIPTTNWSSSMSRVRRLYCVQSGLGGIQGFVDPMKGLTLVSPGNATYQTYVGGSAVNYDTSPNRPVDYIDDVCSASYVGGGTAFSGQSIDSLFTPTTVDLPALNSVVSYTNSGNINAANAIIDGYIRGDLSSVSLPTTASGTTFSTGATAHGLSVGAILRFTATGGTAYSNINLLTTYKILSVPTSTTFTAGQILTGNISSAVNAGSAGTGTMYLNWISDESSPLNTLANQTIFGNMSGLYTKMQYLAKASNGAFSPAPAGGDLGYRIYEGNIVPTPPSSSQCTNIGISSGDCTTLATAVANWRNSATYAIPTTQYFFETFMGTASGTITYNAMSQAKAPSWFFLLGAGTGGIYALQNGNDLVNPYWRQTYYGFKAFSTNWLLKRDLDPASNDNSPMWLEKAA